MLRDLCAVSIALIAIAGCETKVPLPAPPGTEHAPKAFSLRDLPHHPGDRTRVLEELDQQRLRWREKSPLAYELTVSRLCFCDTGKPWVSRNEGSSVTSSHGGFFGDGRNIGPPLRTVEQLFAEAERAARDEMVDEVEVVFDPTFAYPSRIKLDRWRDVIDDELEWIAELRVLK
jgi:hypothetical protein